MSTPGMWWGRSNGCLHPVAPCDITHAGIRGWTEALCGWHLPVTVELLSQPDGGPLCRYPHAEHQQLKVDVRCGEVIDDDYAAAMVAARTGLALADVVVLKVTA
ncbi:MAG: hypothetical protein ACT4NY_30970 [Pseudonocardiales bacterium]